MTGPLPHRLVSALADRYRLERPLGEGGMATVYLAHDLKHHREVALKVLKPELAALVGAERFLGEIRTTANLQHPHILPLFDSGEAGGFVYYVMPYVDGESLRERLDREKQLPVDAAVAIAAKVAGALEHAHEAGVIHRDIKPANILLSRGGEPLVADFGIALAVSAAGGGRLTETGLSVGTPYYMSPEQASADREPSAASDLYSLGCVLYEMLVGEPPFTGATAQAVLARILTATAPAPTQARPSIPPHVDAVVRRSLERLPADRFANAADFARALGDPGFRHGELEVTGPATPAGPWKAAALVAAAVAVVALGVAGRALLAPPPPGDVARFESLFRPGQEPWRTGDFTLSPDGKALVYVGPPEEAGSGLRLWVRHLDQLQASPIPGTEGLTDLAPSVSPDGTEVAFGGRSQEGVSVVRVDGGLIRMVLPDHRYPFWADDGYIYASQARAGISRVPAGGGPPERIQGSLADFSQQWVTDVLPGGRLALLTLTSGDAPAMVFEVAVLDLTTGEVRRIVPGGGARYVDPGYLVFITGGDLTAARFDAGAGTLDGPVVPLVPGVRGFAISDTGTLVLDAASPLNHEFVWATRDGTLTPAIPNWTVSGLTPRGFEISPDGGRLALTLAGGGPGIQDVWVKDLPDGGAQRVSFGDQQAWGPRWRPSGDRLTYSAGVTGGRAMVDRRASGTGPVDTLVGPSLDAPDVQLHPDGEWAVLRAGRSGGRTRFIAAARLGPDPEPPGLILGEDYNAQQPDLSPDGRWLAYTSDETGREEVYLRPFPDVETDRIVVSTDGGLQPRWSRDGRELFYVSAAGEMMAARFEPEPEPRITAREVLFPLPSGLLGLTFSVATNYDVAADGRFLLAREVDDPENDPPGLVLVQNWLTELREALER